MPPDLQIYLLGSFRLMFKGAVVSSAAWEKRKARLLVQILALQPTHETHRTKMRLFSREGERFRVLRQYERCVRVLQREFAVEPDEETKRLKQEIIAERK